MKFTLPQLVTSSPHANHMVVIKEFTALGFAPAEQTLPTL